VRIDTSGRAVGKTPAVDRLSSPGPVAKVVGVIIIVITELNEGPVRSIAARERTSRFPEEFRAPGGVRKSGMPEPAGREVCAMGFSSLSRSRC